jgi:hypothetical protein
MWGVEMVRLLGNCPGAVTQKSPTDGRNSYEAHTFGVQIRNDRDDDRLRQPLRPEIEYAI